MENFSKQEFEIQKEELVRDLSAYKTSSKKPVGYLIVGQPGAGKSTMADIFVGEHSGNICFVYFDAYAGADVVSQVLEEYAEKAIERSLFKARQKTRSR